MMNMIDILHQASEKMKFQIKYKSGDQKDI